jgi:hypothetical protein
MLRISIIIIITCLTRICIGQSPGTKYDFTQIDSLVNVNVKELSKDSFVVAHQVWFIGGHKFDKERRVFYDNQFEVLIYFTEKGHTYVKKIDNFGESISIKLKSKELINFLDSNFYKMKSEKLTIKRDTIVHNDSITKIREGPYLDHQRTDAICINYKGQELTYDFPANFQENKWNLTKKQYLFLKLLQSKTDRTTKKLRTE